MARIANARQLGQSLRKWARERAFTCENFLASVMH